MTRYTIRAPVAAASAAAITGATVSCGSGQEPQSAQPPTVAGGAQLWLQHYDSSAQTPDVAQFTGWSSGPAAGHDFVTAGYDTGTGAQVWTARYAGPGSRDDEARSVTVNRKDGTVLVTGVSADDYATVAYRG
jgi:hypothetical protein